MTLPEFLLARFAEDEVIPYLVEEVEHVGGRRVNLRERYSAELEAKRRIVDWAAPVIGSERVPTGRHGVYNRRPVRYVNDDGEDLLRLLALPYADHPDYRKVWKP